MTERIEVANGMKGKWFVLMEAGSSKIVERRADTGQQCNYSQEKQTGMEMAGCKLSMRAKGKSLDALFKWTLARLMLSID